MLLPLLLLPILTSQLASLGSAVPPAPLAGDEVHGELWGDDSHGDEGRSLLHLVNKNDDTELDADWSPHDMVAISSDFMAPGSRGELRTEAAGALERMLETAKSEGHKILVRSAFRSFVKQKRIFGNKTKRYGLSRASRVSARAGHSQHQLGTTVDIVMPRYRYRITQRIAKSAEWKWLSTNAHLFGYALSYPRGEEELTGYMYEPWHYRYLGIAAATEMWEREMPMESYLHACREGDANLLCGERKRI
jgi:D-alanyl-D-alanine carboxypeptidase